MAHRQTVRQKSVTKLDQFTLLAQSDHLDSQASQSIHHTGYNTHAQRKEQKHQKTYPFKGTQKNQAADGGLKVINAATHYTALADYTTRLPEKKHGPYTVRNSKRATLAITTPVYSLNRAYILLPFSPASAPNQKSQISRLGALFK